MEGPEEGIAVIGIGCNFPGGTTPPHALRILQNVSKGSPLVLGEGLDNFWKVLLEGRNCAVDVPAERFDAAFWCSADESEPGKTQTTKAALVEG